MGFNGIPVALLAYSNPLGIILSSVFIGFLESSGTGFQGLYSTEMTGIIVSVIIYFSAFSLIVSILIKNTIKKAQEKLALIKVNATKEESESSKDFKEVEKEEVPDKKGDEV
jgi:simple sugar transport system permease protein